jgi:hypothetical protein
MTFASLGSNFENPQEQIIEMIKRMMLAANANTPLWFVVAKAMPQNNMQIVLLHNTMSMSNMRNPLR